MRFAFVAALLLAGCQTPCPSTSTPVTRTYRCADGSDLVVTFAGVPDRAHIEQEGFVALDLPGRIMGAGYRYADHGAEMRVQGVQVAWTRPGSAETICRLRQ